MEGLAPPLQCLLDLRCGLDQGHSVRQSLINHIQLRKTPFAKKCSSWLMALEHDQPTSTLLKEESIYRRTLLEIIETGLKGHPIYQRLNELEIELIQACEDELQKHIDLLPFQILIPLLLFQFPAFLLLILGPLMTSLVQELSR